MTLSELGQKFVVLGRALQSDDATLDELTRLAMDCGVQLQFRVVPVEAEEPEPTDKKRPAGSGPRQGGDQ